MLIMLFSNAGRRRWTKGLSAPSYLSRVRGSSPPSWLADLLECLSLEIKRLVAKLKLEISKGKQDHQRKGWKPCSPTRSVWLQKKGCHQVDSCWSKLLQLPPYLLQQKVRIHPVFKYSSVNFAIISLIPSMGWVLTEAQSIRINLSLSPVIY